MLARMTVPALGLAVLAGDAAAIILLILAAIPCARLVAGRGSENPGLKQHWLIPGPGAASLRGRLALGTYALGSGILIIAISGVFPEIVPGAMCGTGVVQASGGLITRALALRLVALGLLSAWNLHDRFNRRTPTSPLGTIPARLLLLATPITIVATLDTASAMKAIDTNAPVDCCAAVYQQVAPLAEGNAVGFVPDTILTGLTLALGVLLFLVAAWTRHRSKQPNSLFPPLLLALLGLAWVPIAAVALVKVFSAYHYGVVHHHCPWCLFLGKHRLVGYPLFGALLLVLFESVGTLLAARVGNAVPALGGQARGRVRTGALRIILAAGLFALLTGLPAVLWRLRHGAWPVS